MTIGWLERKSFGLFSLRSDSRSVMTTGDCESKRGDVDREELLMELTFSSIFPINLRQPQSCILVASLNGVSQTKPMTANKALNLGGARYLQRQDEENDRKIRLP